VLQHVEFFRRGAFIQFPSVWRDDDGAHDNFAIGSVGKQQERRFRSHVEDRLIPWRIQDAVGSRTAESPDPSQCAEKEDVISSNKLDSAINPLRWCLHASGVILPELVYRNKLVKLCRGR
jgi:hypothetical protein